MFRQSKISFFISSMHGIQIYFCIFYGFQRFSWSRFIVPFFSMACLTLTFLLYALLPQLRLVYIHSGQWIKISNGFLQFLKLKIIRWARNRPEFLAHNEVTNIFCRVGELIFKLKNQGQAKVMYLLFQVKMKLVYIDKFVNCHLSQRIPETRGSVGDRLSLADQ